GLVLRRLPHHPPRRLRHAAQPARAPLPAERPPAAERRRRRVGACARRPRDPAAARRRGHQTKPLRSNDHQPAIALPLWLGTYFIWHLPWLYDTALRHPNTLLHLEHACYFLAGAVFWWPVVHGRRSSGRKAAYLFAAFVLVSPLALLLALLP